MFTWEEWKREFLITLWFYFRASVLMTLFSVVFIMAAEAIDPDLADSIIAKTRVMHKSIFGH